jgi:hypothetical protein
MILCARDNRIDDKQSKSISPSFDLADVRESTLDAESVLDAPLQDDTVNPVLDIVNLASPNMTGNLAFNGRLRDCEYELFIILGMIMIVLLECHGCCTSRTQQH